MHPLNLFVSVCSRIPDDINGDGVVRLFIDLLLFDWEVVLRFKLSDDFQHRYVRIGTCFEGCECIDQFTIVSRNHSRLRPLKEVFHEIGGFQCSRAFDPDDVLSVADYMASRKQFSWTNEDGSSRGICRFTSIVTQNTNITDTLGSCP